MIKGGISTDICRPTFGWPACGSCKHPWINGPKTKAEKMRKVILLLLITETSKQGRFS